MTNTNVVNSPLELQEYIIDCIPDNSRFPNGLPIIFKDNIFDKIDKLWIYQSSYNWRCDLCSGGTFYRFKLPKEMSQISIYEYFKPLILVSLKKV